MTMIPIRRFLPSSFVNGVLHLIFPESCLSCDNELTEKEQHLCSICLSDLTVTNFHLFKEATPVDKLFWGRVNIEGSYSHIFFEKNKASQSLLFEFKYKNKPTIGNYFGKEIAKNISQMTCFQSADVFVPVPLHPRKKYIRGYNQSEYLAKGVSEALNLPMDLSVIKRVQFSETQTKKSRFQRWDNVSSIFHVSKNIHDYNHIVLVDDVITTGSTLEAIAQAILEVNPKVKISIVTLAIA